LHRYFSVFFFFFSSRRRHTRSLCDWSSDVCSSDLHLDNMPLLILAAVIAVYLILGMLYESLIHPLTIISTLPSAGLGALLALYRSEERRVGKEGRSRWSPYH